MAVAEHLDTIKDAAPAEAVAVADGAIDADFFHEFEGQVAQGVRSGSGRVVSGVGFVLLGVIECHWSWLSTADGHTEVDAGWMSSNLSSAAVCRFTDGANFLLRVAGPPQAVWHGAATSRLARRELRS